MPGLTLVGPALKVYATGPNKNYGLAPVISEAGLTGLSRLEVRECAYNIDNRCNVFVSNFSASNAANSGRGDDAI